jgi:hypothetical protein
MNTFIRICGGCLLAIFAVSLSSCAFAPVDKPGIDTISKKTNRYYEIGYEKTADLASLAAESMGYKVGREMGQIRSTMKPVLIQGNCNCGTWNGTAIQGYADSVLMIDVTKLSDTKSQVTLEARFATRFQGRNLYGMVTRDETYPCASTGGLENQYFASLDRLVAHMGKYGDKKIAEPDKDAAKPAKADAKPDKDKAKPETAGSEPPKAAAEPKAESKSDIIGGGGQAPEGSRLQKLKSLKAMGLISEAEFQAESAKLKAEQEKKDVESTKVQ